MLYLNNSNIKKWFLNGHKLKEIFLDGISVFKDEKKVDLSVTTEQPGQPDMSSWVSDSHTNTDGFTSFILDYYYPGTSYGRCRTQIIIHSGNKTTVWKDNDRYYTGSSHNNGYTKPNPPDKFTGLKKGDIVELRVSANRDPNVSTPLTSTSTCGIILTN